MSFTVAVQDADQYRLQVAGVNISRGAGQSGYGDDEFLKISPVGESFVEAQGTDGTLAWSKTNDRRLDIIITLLQTSSSNDFLSALHLSDVSLPNGAGVGSFVLQDLSGTTLVKCPKCRIFKPADILLGRGAKSREWKLRGVWDVYLVGSN